ncbi:MAG: hypothetical protein ACK6CT_12060 [Planctomycetia bacterium]|jgi:hypothetical protein
MESRPFSRLQVAQLWADLVSKVLGAVAILVAAWWTYANFTVERTHDPTMVVSLSPRVHPLRGGEVLLNVDVLMENIGKVAIKPRFSHKDERDVGLEISIVEIEPLARAARPAAEAGSPPAEPSEAADPAVRWFDWTLGDGNPRTLLLKRNLLATNEDYLRRRYLLNPGVKYREPFACIVERGKLYAIRARFWTDRGAVADLVYVDTLSAVPAGDRP